MVCVDYSYSHLPSSLRADEMVVTIANNGVFVQSLLPEVEHNMQNYDLGPIKALIGWVRFVRQPDELDSDERKRQRLRVEKMSYDDEDINLNPDVIINATSEPCGIELREITNGWVIEVGGSPYGKYEYDDSRYGVARSGWGQAKQAVTDMSVLQWMALTL